MTAANQKRVSQMKIRIDRQKVYARHGALSQEQPVGAYFYVSAEIETDFTAAMDSDCLSDTINYADIAQTIKEEMEKPSQLMEHVAGRIAKRILNRFPTAKTVIISLSKENPPLGVECRGAGVELTLCRKDS